MPKKNCLKSATFLSGFLLLINILYLIANLSVYKTRKRF